MRSFMLLLLILLSPSFSALASSAASQADFEFACAAEIKQFKQRYPNIPKSEWMDRAWEQRFTKFMQPGAFFHVMKSETDPKKLAYYTLLACGSIAWLEQKKSGVGSSAKARERWRKAFATFKQQQVAERSDKDVNNVTTKQAGTPENLSKGTKGSASMTKGPWPAGVKPGNLYIVSYYRPLGGRNSKREHLLVSANSKNEAHDLVQRSIVNAAEFSNKGLSTRNHRKSDEFGVIYRNETVECKGPNWGATIDVGFEDRSFTTVTVCGAKTPREAILAAEKKCVDEARRPCKVEGGGFSVTIGHSGAWPWGESVPMLWTNSFPYYKMKYAALAASTMQTFHFFTRSPQEAISQFGKACGARHTGRDNYSCWITSKNRECILTVQGENGYAAQHKCVDKKLTAEGYLP